MKEHFWLDLPRPDVFYTEFTNTVSYGNPDGIFTERGRLTLEEKEQPKRADCRSV